MLLDSQPNLVNQIGFERKVEIKFGTSKFEFFEGPLGDVPDQPPRGIPWTSD